MKPKSEVLFREDKIGKVVVGKKIPVTTGQVEYEFKHLLGKLKKRDIALYENLRKIKTIDINPVFEIIEGEKEFWEKGK